jgi:hypothetical protein
VPSQPLVSVIIPAHNTGPLLTETVESALRQTYPRREIIVVDDGSTEDLGPHLAPYGDAVSYLRQENAGAGAARNTGVSAAAGDYIAFLDHDDLWLPAKLEVQVAVAARHPESGLIVCDGVQFDGDKILLPSLIHGSLGEGLAASPTGEITGRFQREFVQANPLCCPAQGLIPRPVIEQIGSHTTIRGEASDFDYNLRIALAYPVTFHRDRLVRWRYLPSSVSGPQERRVVVWKVMAAAVLARQRTLCAPVDRPLVTAGFGSLALQAARSAYYYGREHDRTYARSCLAKLLRMAPWRSRAALYLIALELPDPWMSAVLDRRRRFRELRRVSAAHTQCEQWSPTGSSDEHET